MLNTELIPANLVDELASLAWQCATGAGRLLVDERPKANLAVDVKSTATDVVTAMDIASEEYIRALISTFRPDDAVLGEEHGSADGTSNIRWVIDPLDGTTNYLYGLPVWAVSVAAQMRDADDPIRWHSIVGVVAAPLLGCTWHARIDGPAFVDDASGRHLLEVGACDELSQALVATGFGYNPARRAEQGSTVAHMASRVRDLRRMGAASVDLCWVAQGLIDAYWERGLAPWDHAAGELIVAQAGGQVGDLDGGPAGSAITVACNSQLWQQMVDQLQRGDVLGSGI